MNKKLFSLSILTIAFAVGFLFAASNGTMAAGDNYNGVSVYSTNLLEVALRHNGITSPDNFDRDFDFLSAQERVDLNLDIRR